MMVIVLLLGASLTLALGFLVAFLISAKGGQFDDPVTPAMRMLHDDEPGPESSAPTDPKKETTL
jgi:cbb3-type cytochrome oxidase maturation protein